MLAGALLWAYWPTLAGLSRRWSEDPQYSHGYVVPVIAVLVLWHRRQRFPHEAFQTSWWGLVPLLVGAGLRLVGARLHFDWLDAASLLPTVVGICLLAGGWPLSAWAWPAAVFVCFLLPLPFQAEIALAHPLQRLATVASTYALQTVGLPAVAEGNIIVIDELRIGVLEACSGLGMLVTFFALSTAVAFLVERPLVDRLVLFASATPIGICVNVLRITITGILHKTAGSAIANAVFHDLAGWLMMPLALGLLWLEMLYLRRLFPASPQAKRVPAAMPTSSRTARSTQLLTPTPISGR
jgi:exosortase